MSKLSALFATAMLGITYGAYAGDGACNHAKKDVNAAVETNRMQLASGYPESGANNTSSGDMTDDMSTGNTRSGAADATTGNRSGSGASGGTGSTGAGTTGTGSTGTETTGSDSMDNSTTGSGTTGTGTSSGDM